MGQDNQPKHRQHSRRVEREKRKRQTYPRILICCEGRKTEPYYLDEVRSYLGIPKAAVTIEGYGSDPSHLVDRAIHQFREFPTFDRVYCVFDRDSHTHFNAALARIRQTPLKLSRSKAADFRAFASVPNFELWLLLHFQEMRRHIERDQAFSQLKRHLPNYSKGTEGTFAATRDHLDEATDRASKLAFPGNPSTQIGELVAILREIAANHG